LNRSGAPGDHDRQAVVFSLVPTPIIPLLWPGAQPLTIRGEFCEPAIGRRRFVLAERFLLERFKRRP
jgi:hypothetical protein